MEMLTAQNKNGFGGNKPWQNRNSFNNQSHSQERKTPFRRVKTEEVEVDQKFADNSFDAKRGARGSWGERASKDLIHTRGKSFRHEKTKKKRGNYRGGAITMEVNSIRYDDDGN